MPKKSIVCCWYERMPVSSKTPSAMQAVIWPVYTTTRVQLDVFNLYCSLTRTLKLPLCFHVSCLH